MLFEWNQMENYWWKEKRTKNILNTIHPLLYGGRYDKLDTPTISFDEFTVHKWNLISCKNFPNFISFSLFFSLSIYFLIISQRKHFLMGSFRVRYTTLTDYFREDFHRKELICERAFDTWGNKWLNIVVYIWLINWVVGKNAAAEYK